MKFRYAIAAGVIALVTMAATSGLTAAQAQATAAQAARAEQPDQPITVTGCVMREADYRRARDAGKGGVAGSGVGVGNEFVLTQVSTAASGSAGASVGTAGAAGGTPTGTAGTAATAAYELTGPNEGRAEQFVGRRVEIAGTLKKADVGAAGPTGGATAGEPPAGVDLTSRDLKLRELEVASVREATGTCPAQ
jgi:hypothetical protein